MQLQSDNSHNVPLNGQVNNSGEIKIIHCINTAAWAANRPHEKEANLNPKCINSVLSRRCTAPYPLQLAASGRWKGPSVPARRCSHGHFHLLPSPSRSRSCLFFFSRVSDTPQQYSSPSLQIGVGHRWRIGWCASQLLLSSWNAPRGDFALNLWGICTGFRIDFSKSVISAWITAVQKWELLTQT